MMTGVKTYMTPKLISNEMTRGNTQLGFSLTARNVFDGEKTAPYTTEDKPNPINEYGKSKLLGEQYIQYILDNYFTIRTSWLYSKKYGNNFYKFIFIIYN